MTPQNHVKAKRGRTMRQRRRCCARTLSAWAQSLARYYKHCAPSDNPAAYNDGNGGLRWYR